MQLRVHTDHKLFFYPKFVSVIEWFQIQQLLPVLFYHLFLVLRKELTLNINIELLYSILNP